MSIESVTEGGITYQVNTDENGHKRWLLNGNRHRVDGPACEYASGSKLWYLNGKWHRVDGPAYEDANGTKRWYLNGKKHRVDGPAVERTNGTKEWYLNDERLTEGAFKRFRVKLKELKQHPLDAPLYLHDKYLGSIAQELLENGGIPV